ncbi:SMC-Scp complex subunit ScpB [Candidatus Woesearchaeota archaeon]|jgi:segregation and condensation protein B|nr:SMC-Scp complex subunit ScpB [Candidatus Woesearchaeota archaeon]MBT5396823.1 SMC-Scp complex subunit ScpB [Candidatus Woesearchaeota archaeon]MBT5924639.1 SMC-Scp complex subunit ScpB [Candidatus Woesearchaeota archaeon]MBT6367711.1 SMC-Scp complex subunit ScpB [Candidatus Woesearchaeota archaeon]MBT7762888.1 SMC-Scp complex subunit ScpB [Candidatus Woesearchaeota archaeon]
MSSDEKRVEAVIFAVGKEITTERIAHLCSLDNKNVEKIMKGLQKEYSQRDHSLQIVTKDNGWKLTVRDEFVPLVSSIVSSTELEKPLMETLAVIAWKYPIIQSEIVKLRGASAYDHMKQLGEQGFIAKEKFGRTYKVKLTQKFFGYFDLPTEEAKNAFLKLVPEDVLAEAENVHKEADEVERLVELEKNEKGSKDEIRSAMDDVQKE